MIEGARRTLIFLYTDEDVTDRLAALLQERGYEAASAGSTGRRGSSDEEQLAFAASRGWTILTYNKRDFTRLAQSWYANGREHAGIVLSRQFSAERTGELLRQTCNLLESVSAEEMWNTVYVLQSYS
jgi:predicted nuclease of predicted toxin-antitoxin system